MIKLSITLQCKCKFYKYNNYALNIIVIKKKITYDSSYYSKNTESDI